MIINGSISARKQEAALKSHLRMLAAAAKRFGGQKAGRHSLPQEFEWLLDNRYLCQREGLETAADLRGAGRLPRGKRHSHVYELAADLALSRDGDLGRDKVAAFLQTAQKTRPLTEKELWLFVPMLRAALVAGVADCCGEMSDIYQSYQQGGADDPFAAELRAKEARSMGSIPDERTEALAGKAEETHRRLSARMGVLISSLRFLSVTDLTETLRNASAMEQLLGSDPAGVYPHMDEDSRGQYRNALSHLARRHHLSEDETARRILSLCAAATEPRERHVGYYLREKPMGKAASPHAGRLYFTAMLLLTLVPVLLSIYLTSAVWVGLILLLPLFSMTKNVTDAIATRLRRPRLLPRLELKDGLPGHGKTLCVISLLLTGADKAADYAAKLESYRLANRDAGKNLYFGLLCDLPDADQRIKESDEEIQGAAHKAIRELNRKYGGGFYVFTRERRLNRRDGVYMAWERKRGALIELARLLRGKATGLRVETGEEQALDGVRYVITLDSDTALCPGAASQMVGSMLHPLIQPVIDTERRVVVKGHGLLAPRMTTGLEAAGRSFFARVFAGQGGLDPYGGAAGDVYHDLFDEGSFTGKGIFDIDAFLTCLDGRFPQNRILSHDLLEGCYLRAGLLGNVELTDGFPARVSAWFERQHRWIRGDWQIMSWLFSRVPGGDKKERNPLNGLSRWKIFDNLRRSVTPVATLAALTLGTLFPGPTQAVVFAAALCTFASHLLIGLAERLSRFRAKRARYHSAVITGLPAVFWQTVLQLLFLPYQAIMNLHAAFTAIIRVHITRRRLLEWVPSAETERFRYGAVTMVRKMFPGLVWGVLTSCLARSPVGWILGVAWALSPFAAVLIGQQQAKTDGLRGSDRAFLLRQAALMWRYFEDFLRPEDHYLPPDNWQEQPAAGLARRTSPTNIGLGLLCGLAAVDMGLCSRERLIHLTDATLSTLEALPKWHGHIYNWYETRHLTPLRPCCVSTVDSGNLCGCLIALAEGLPELEDARAMELADRARLLADNMDFRPLYDEERRLFVISRDMDNPEAPTGYYDLLASEARQTSYLCVARGDVDKKHWKRLSRAQTELGLYRGMASWTGTMFEYFMPHLLLPAKRDSLLRESLDFCVYAQREQAAGWGTPWGVSESCFYAFDTALTYQYKAHGTPALAFKRGLGKDHVIAPYASFLALLTHPRAAVKNLREFGKQGLEGPYGFIEAVDYTPGRQTGTEPPPRQVRCFMSHHLGMSILSVCNALHENVMQKRFMRNPAMGAFSALLEERLPVGAATIRTVGRDVPDKPHRSEGSTLYRESDRIDPAAPRMTLLSNASYTLLCADSGFTSSSCAGLQLVRADAGAREGGLRFFFRQNGVAQPLLAFEKRDGGENHAALFEGHRVGWVCHGQGWDARLTALIPENENAELRVLTLQNRTDNTLRGEAVCYFEPVMQPLADYASHPAFSKLFVETRIVDGAVLLRRRPRGGKGEVWLCFVCRDAGVRFDTSRERALGRSGVLRLSAALDKEPMSTEGAVLDPCVLARVPVELAAGGSVTLRFALAAGNSAEDALSAGRRLCRNNTVSGSSRPDGAARSLSLTVSQCLEALDWLPRLTAPPPPPEDCREGLRAGVHGLWSQGISGDLPIVLAQAFDPARMEQIGIIIRQHRYLTLCGYACDLVILTRDGSDYRRPVFRLLTEMLKNIQAEGSLDAGGGVHIVDLGAALPVMPELLRGFAAVITGEEEPPRPETTIPRYKPPTPEMRPPETVECSRLQDGSFVFATDGRLPPLGWSHTLVTRGFGALVTETGGGYIWRKNARENKLTPWGGDPLAQGGGMELRLRVGDILVSPFAAEDGLPCRVTYGFGWARWEKSMGGQPIVTTQFVPHERMALVTTVDCGGQNDVELMFTARLVMGAEERMGRTVTITQRDNGVVCARNPLNTQFGEQTLLFAASSPPRLRPGPAGTLCAEVTPTPTKNGCRTVLVLGCACNEPGLSLLADLAESKEADFALAHTEDHWRSLTKQSLPPSGSAAVDRYMDGWALYQVIATRLLSRTSMYQCGGAYGFRDQLQDACAAVYARPSFLRTQILRAAARQYEEGDVMHWWHPGTGSKGYSDKGVRTRCSDDLLWLPYSVCEYLDHSGDTALLEQVVPYLSSPLLTDEGDRYENAVMTKAKGSVYDHCCRVMDLVMERGVGEHGLCLMGEGDWNDGMNRVGHKGRGESVWLTWFAAHALDRFAPLCDNRGDRDRGRQYRAHADALVSAAAGAWDGEWFLRGYYDDGTTLGSSGDEECRIDSIAQSFSALFVGRVSLERIRTAMDSAYRMLVDKERRLVKLFTPAFTGTVRDPGYICGYLPGVRENGGQYTHAAVWLAMGFAKLGEREKALEILDILMPETHDPHVYMAEPHVLAADVYSHPAHKGRGGWSHYTGAAGWFYRVARSLCEDKAVVS